MYDLFGECLGDLGGGFERVENGGGGGVFDLSVKDILVSSRRGCDCASIDLVDEKSRGIDGSDAQT